MIVARHPEELATVPRAVAIGTFDGVHVGHQRVIRGALATGLRAAVITFDPHPRSVLGREVGLLSTLERRLELIESLGVPEVLLVEFTRELAETPAEQWARRFLAGLGAVRVFVGEDFRFGRGRAGDTRLLRRLGFRVDGVPIVAGASATRVRGCLGRGDIEHATRLLGRIPELEVRVLGPASDPDATEAVLERNLLVPGGGYYRGLVEGRGVEVSVEPCWSDAGGGFVCVDGLPAGLRDLDRPVRIGLTERLSAAVGSLQGWSLVAAAA